MYIAARMEELFSVFIVIYFTSEAFNLVLKIEDIFLGRSYNGILKCRKKSGN